jgi:hypothetical protein|nr:MAG TPA: hypothetical protein [Caudoviricetes sp.]
MLLGKQLQIIVFKVDNEAFEQVGVVSTFTSLSWPTTYRGYGEFKLTCPVTDETKELIVEGNLIWCDGYKNAGIIETVHAEDNDEGVFMYDVSGFTLEFLLTNRVVWGTYYAFNEYVSTIAMEIVNSSCINPSDIARKYKWLSLGEDAKLGGKITKQQTGNDIYSILDEMLADVGLGFSIDFLPVERKLEFNVTSGVDRSVNQSLVEVVVLSTDMEDILDSAYELSIQDEKTIAFVQAENSGENRKSTTAGDESKTGFDRKELYVDARDLQSSSATGGQKMTDAEYVEAMKQRGLEKLSKYVKSKSFDLSIRVFGDTQYVFGKDYFVGDKITIQDIRLGVQVDAIISKIEEDFENTYDLSMTVGFSNLTILQKIDRISR